MNYMLNMEHRNVKMKKFRKIIELTIFFLWLLFLFIVTFVIDINYKEEFGVFIIVMVLITIILLIIASFGDKYLK